MAGRISPARGQKWGWRSCRLLRVKGRDLRVLLSPQNLLWNRVRLDHIKTMLIQKLSICGPIMSCTPLTLPSINLIRLLHLQSGVEGQPVAYSLIVIINHKSTPEYHTLSYFSGDANDKINSFCNRTSFLIMKSLHAAVCRLEQKHCHN
jgi:hypothetical protein